MYDARNEIVKQKIENLAMQLMPIAAEPNLALALVKMMNTDSAKEAERVFEKGIEAMNKLKAQQDKNAGAAQQAQAALLKEQEDNKNLREKIKAMAAENVAKINKEAKLEDTEMRLEHKANEQTVKKSDKIDEMLAQHEIQKDLQPEEVSEMAEK